MRLLVFEFITGGGFINQPLPASLLQEGYLMRNALIDDLCTIADLNLLVLQDQRLDLNLENQAAGIEYVMMSQEEGLQTLLFRRQSEYDAVWLIAPETDGILAQWCRFFGKQGKFLYTSAHQAVEICQDKLMTTKLLQNAGIACVSSCLYDSSQAQRQGSWVIKSNDSAGCDQVYQIHSSDDWQNVVPRLLAEKSYIIQPYISGKSLSLSCLFYQRKAYFICCNEQHTHSEQQQIILSACTVNINNKNNQCYQLLCQQIATAIPQLFGYVGIDFIETETGENLILEINPRLTTSYAGINEALGVNVAELVLNLSGKPPLLNKIRSQQVLVSIDQGNADAS
ncbi:hypothetical protein AU255_11215 [Methyloprofundus sedimenti]|uniref:ATP-grasp domain-containing protein n=1 Tax=Methyloprofundus sedimenti TaxID=1420851 RepID=A0A1V8M9S2_9GAMM|nr:ATP-grasp domain-containing protein [Methyloprofundus sedimenti]OQK18354.1 hypothetical protein AU255_11215 [Methyloprofundus sedimenti]